jgi:hypothetical protein
LVVVLRYIIVDRCIKVRVEESVGGSSLVPGKFDRFSVSVAVSPHIFLAGRLGVHPDLMLVCWK